MSLSYNSNMATNFDPMDWPNLQDDPPTALFDEYESQQYHSTYQTFANLENGQYNGPENSHITQPNYLPPNLNHDPYPTSMANVLPQLDSDVVSKLLSSTNSFGKLSLEQDSSPLDAQHQLPYMNGLNGMNGSMGSGSSGSNGDGSFVNSPFPNTPVQNFHHQETQSPHRIEILEEPMEFGYRFRYEVEGKAHGGLQGQSSKAANGNGLKKGGAKIYPEIQVCNVPDHVNEMRIEARLVSATEDFYPHPNKCSGKDCNSAGVYRKLLKRTESTEFRLVFGNLTILQIKKGDQKASLLDQLKDINQNVSVRPQMTDREIEKKTEELGKIKHNGVVRIRFQASYYDELEQKWHVAVTHSKPVHDQKQTNAAELRICKVSSVAAPATGGTSEIFLLCEKVTKDDIKVKFLHGDWEADGRFQGTDVHYQFAIVFRAPPYKDLHIKKEVKVDLKLFRPSTGTYSKPLPFTYYPTSSEGEGVQRKRKRPDGYGPNNMPGYPPFPPFGGSPFGEGPSNGSQGGNGNFGQGYFGRSNFGGYNRAAHTPECDEVPMNLTVSKDNNLPATLDTVDEVESDHAAPVNLVKTEIVDPSSPSSPKPAEKMEGVKDELADVKPEAKADDDDLETDHMLIVRHEKLSPIDGRPRMVTKDNSLVKTSNSGGNNSNQQNGDKKMLKTVEGELTREKAKVKGLQYHVAECEDMVIDAVMNYATTGDALYFVSQFRHFLAVRDEYGDNSVHMAVINEQHKALRDMLNICTATKTLPAINQLNDKQQTPIHLATILGDVEMVRVLLNHSANPSIKDQSGNNCFHVAAKNGDYRVMELLCDWLRFSKADKSIVDEFNYEGESALHVAVQVDSIECMCKLIGAGADINMADGTTGRTPLHHSVLKGNVVTTAELVFQANINVDAQAYDGNSPLHLAISIGNMDLCRMLIKSGADPLVKNRDYSPVEMGDDEEAIGMNAYDMCAKDEKLLATIRSALTRESKAPHLVGSIESLPKNTTNKLSNLLDRETQDWKRLANTFELASLVDYMENSGNPTVSLLNYLAKNDKTIKDLAQGLVTISRLDCVEVIEKWNPNATGRLVCGVVDSGFVESFASGTTRSGQMK